MCDDRHGAWDIVAHGIRPNAMMVEVSSLAFFNLYIIQGMSWQAFSVFFRPGYIPYIVHICGDQHDAPVT
jgi:hypothetical protein